MTSANFYLGLLDRPLMHAVNMVYIWICSDQNYFLCATRANSTIYSVKRTIELENIGSRIDMQTHAGSTSTRP